MPVNRCAFVEAVLDIDPEPVVDGAAAVPVPALTR